MRILVKEKRSSADMVHGLAGAPGWSNSSTRMLTPQRPNEAPSTSSQGDIYVSSTFQVPDGSQCGGTGGALRQTFKHTAHTMIP